MSRAESNIRPLVLFLCGSYTDYDDDDDDDEDEDEEEPLSSEEESDSSMERYQQRGW